MRMRLFKILIILCFPSILFAESITLKSGKKIEGKITEKTDQYIKIEVDATPIYYERKFIATIDESKESVPLPKEDAGSMNPDYFKNGLQYCSEAKFQEAEDEFKKGLSVDPNSRNFKEVLKIIEGLKSGQIKQDYAIHVFKGSYCLTESRFEQAISEFKSALEINPDADVYYYLGVCNYSSGKYEDAIGYLKKALQTIKADNEIYYTLGISYYAQGLYPEAINYLQEALKINPEDAESYGVLGTCHFLLGQLEQAREELYKSRDLFRKHGNYLKAADVETFLKQSNL
jgi:tetratricopeptide (TPR) repeat protein